MVALAMQVAAGVSDLRTSPGTSLEIRGAELRCWLGTCEVCCQLWLCPSIDTWALLALPCSLHTPSLPQMAASSCCHLVWASSRAGMWNRRRWPRGCAGWRRRISSSGCSSARLRRRAATAARSGGLLPRAETPPGARGATARPAPSSRQCTSVRWVMAPARWHRG